MNNKLLSAVLLFALLAAFGFVTYANGAEAAKAAAQEPFYVELKGSGIYVDRSKKFGLGNTADFINGTGQNVGQIDFNMDKWGGGYGFTVGTTKLEPLRLEGSFEEFFVSFDKTKGDLPTDPTGIVTLTDASIIPFVDDSHGITGKGFCPGWDPSNPIDYDLNYSLRYFSCNVNMIYDAMNKDDFTISLFGGPVYTHFRQKYTVQTNGGIRWPVITSTSSNTKEKLTDDLFGGRMGIRCRKGLFDKFVILSDVSTDLYYRRSSLKARQELVNAFTSDTINLLGNPLDNITLEKKHTKSGFVPRLTSNVVLSYELFPNITMSTFYQFDYWWNLSKIVNPIVTFNPVGAFAQQDGSVRIEKENLISHAIGGKIGVAF